MPFIGLAKPKQQDVSERLDIGDTVPEGLASHGQYSLIVFLRHTGCPFAEAMLKDLSELADEHAELHCVAVCHGEHDITQAWINQFELSPELNIYFDDNRELYGKWGLGYSNIFHLANPKMLYSLISLLPQGIHNRDASGTRWQPHASFLVCPDQTVQWVHYPQHAGDLPDLHDAANAIWE